jgi:hypothetical protein
MSRRPYEKPDLLKRMILPVVVSGLTPASPPSTPTPP